MARYKHIDTNPKFLPVDLARQLLPGTFEHALNHLIDHELDLSGFDARYRNDERGASAYPPAVLLKIILFAYSRGIVSSRAIERACRDHVTFIALSGDRAPHFTTIAAFVASLGDEIATIFSQILFVCDREGLIGREMFAIDGVKLPSNASKHKSGTRADFQRQAAKLEKAARTMLARHREDDQQRAEPDLDERVQARIDRLHKAAASIRRWLAEHPEDRRGVGRKARKSNRTDNDSAKMATSKGVIQGYTGAAVVDAKCQIIVEAQAHGTGSEHELLLPLVNAAGPMLGEDTTVLADSGYHSEANVKALDELGVDALLADQGMRKRDERFATQDRYRSSPDPLHDKSPKKPAAAQVFKSSDFQHDLQARTCVCPAGNRLYRTGSRVLDGQRVVTFRGAKSTCLPCDLRDRCLRTPAKTQTRQVAFSLGKAEDGELSLVEKMKRRIDSPEGRVLYGRRLGTVEPVFGNLRANKRLDRFTLRGRSKVDGQWKLMALVQNIEKLAHYVYATAA